MNTEITIVLRSLTHAVKGQKLLLTSGIHCKIIRLSDLDEGCGYGISVSAPLADAAAKILKSNRIPVIKIMRG